MREINSRLMLIMRFLFPPTASFIKTTIQWVTQLADVVFVSVFLTVRLGRSDAEVEWCILSGIVRRS